jgi:hypothetical protein
VPACRGKSIRHVSSTGLATRVFKASRVSYYKITLLLFDKKALKT